MSGDKGNQGCRTRDSDPDSDSSNNFQDSVSDSRFDYWTKTLRVVESPPKGDWGQHFLE